MPFAEQIETNRIAHAYNDRHTNPAERQCNEQIPKLGILRNIGIVYGRFNQ